MPIGINNSVLYIDYLQKVWFFHTRPQAVHLHNLSQKVMFYSLMETGMLKKIMIAGLAFTVTNNYLTKDNLRSLQSSIIALRT